MQATAEVPLLADAIAEHDVEDVPLVPVRRRLDAILEGAGRARQGVGGPSVHALARCETQHGLEAVGEAPGADDEVVELRDVALGGGGEVVVLQVVEAPEVGILGEDRLVSDRELVAEAALNVALEAALEPEALDAGDRHREARRLVIEAEVLAQRPAIVDLLAEQNSRVEADRVRDAGGLRQHRRGADLRVDVGAHARADLDRPLLPQHLGVEAGRGDEAVAEQYGQVVGDAGAADLGVRPEDLELLIDAEAELAVAALTERHTDVDARADLPLRRANG